MYTPMKKVLEDLMKISRDLQRSESSKDHRHGIRVKSDTKQLAKTFMHCLSHRLDTIRDEFEQIVGE